MAEEKSREAGQGEGGKKVAADTMDPHGEGRHMIPVWFFVGVLLLIYGILILIQGISEWSNPAATVLSDNPNFANVLTKLNPTFWWSLVLIVLGGIFCVKHFPRKKA
jgi:divalent metal cation (Fe/Co/Zn/Cd) transporter